ncbi:Diaminopimelate epimerase-like protein [Cutaneotrichosporon oleaginosum]|uniref:trans-L-3-hydroxyproline dehydratase n=1 Tax=Cutaneotrichosporon oleaginosum TaxID=879819 RepID=A0A0J0XG32_9TREE|nr:Diaminopimelate epimerase-like protein [Cutaneotrichosporon oleaginosum]KLT40030.1 Diaminopimelate epimerase-like protein [Cutaneotrichosporon oleaginosum]TXT13828.1 hypothetical protein COLE_00021 [Cutaneotrichosporon oleaginosum]
MSATASSPAAKAFPKPIWVRSDDWHTAGEPFRIVSELPEQCTTSGATVMERRLNIMATPDHPVDVLRRALCLEPRGHADMYGGFIVPANDAGAAFGVLFWHKDGFSTACGHGTIALGCWAIATGRVKLQQPDGVTDVVIDVPSGRVVAAVRTCRGQPVSADFVNVPSYLVASDIGVHVKSRGVDVVADLSYGGALYGFVNVRALGMTISPAAHDEYVALGREIKAALKVSAAQHRHNYLYGVCFYEPLTEDRDELHQRNVVVYAEGAVDRSPCGSGTAARTAMLLAQGKLGVGKGRLHHTSIINTIFIARVDSEVPSPTAFPACIPRITGMAHLMGRSEYYLDCADPTFPGFVFRPE